MPMTITEKILAKHAGLESVAPGDLIEAKVDLAFAHDFTAPIAIQVFKEIGAPKVFDRKKVVLVADHFVPNKDIASAEQAKLHARPLPGSSSSSITTKSVRPASATCSCRSRGSSFPVS